MEKNLKYQSGFGNDFATEALPGALPSGQNNPQKVPHGLYAELLSGSPFTVRRKEVQRSWLYRIQPSVTHKPFVVLPNKNIITAGINDSETPTTPNQLRWDPMDVPAQPTNFLNGLHTVCTAGSVASNTGLGIHLYAFNTAMTDEYFYNADGDMMFVPEQGAIRLKTECGLLEVNPLEIAIIPRGIKFSVEPLNKTARGYVGENYGQPFALPDCGPIGTNSLAQPRDFLTPTAWYEERRGNFKLICKFQGYLWSAPIDHSPFDVVAWHGNYAPYKYNLRNYQVVGTVSIDHPDPSIFTVLSSPTDHPGMANIDFVIFPPRWMVAENTFRPPYYHRNVMSEYMGLIEGVYDAKEGGKGGFVPGGGSLHNCMHAHGPDQAAYEKATAADLKPIKLQNTMAFMFETRMVYKPTGFGLTGGLLQNDYFECWQGLKAGFKKP